MTGNAANAVLCDSNSKLNSTSISNLPTADLLTLAAHHSRIRWIRVICLADAPTLANGALSEGDSVATQNAILTLLPLFGPIPIRNHILVLKILLSRWELQLNCSCPYMVAIGIDILRPLQ